MTTKKADDATGEDGAVASPEDRRAPLEEQPIALAVAEEAGTLPAEDRRHEDVASDVGPEPSGEDGPEEAPALSETETILAAAQPSSHFTKTATGWKVSFVRHVGGPAIACEGPTIPAALASHGLQIPTDSFGTVHAEHVGPQHTEMPVS